MKRSGLGMCFTLAALTASCTPGSPAPGSPLPAERIAPQSVSATVTGSELIVLFQRLDSLPAWHQFVSTAPDAEIEWRFGYLGIMMSVSSRVRLSPAGAPVGLRGDREIVRMHHYGGMFLNIIAKLSGRLSIVDGRLQVRMTTPGILDSIRLSRPDSLWAVLYLPTADSGLKTTTRLLYR